MDAQLMPAPANGLIWTRRMTGRARDLGGAQCTHERKPDLGYTDASLTLPSYYKGENLRVITLHASETDVELAAPAQLLEILLYSVATTTSILPEVAGPQGTV
jgi:hypothetical protein